MPSCLGVYVENNLIKYAKISKNNEAVKLEAFGVKFYEHLETAIQQIVEETYSFKVPISVNTTEEWYNEIQVFNLLAKKDMENVIKTEFENICYENERNRNIYEERFIFTKSFKGDDKIKAIHIAVPKISIEQQKNRFVKYRLNSIAPLSIAVSNLISKERKGTNVIVNIEKNTTITKVVDGVVSNVEVIEIGAQDILDRINKKENSYAKAYEICKNSTIYTDTDSDLQYEENEYLEDIMPTLFQIVSKVRTATVESLEKIDNVYITGTGAIINNIDIYFQDYLKNVHCEILKPSFVANNSKINIKDYIEVNSAIAMALQGLDKNNRTTNFKGETGSERLLSSLNADISDIKFTQLFLDIGQKFSRQLDFFSATTILVTIAYFVGATVVNGLLDNRINEANTKINDTNARISKIQQYEEIFDARTIKYQSLISSIQDITNVNSEDKRYKNTIPNLLNNIMTIIPKGVQLTSIANTNDTHIVIVARAKELQQIAYFKTELQTEGVLENVVSDPGRSEANGEEVYLIVTIEGELP